MSRHTGILFATVALLAGAPAMLSADNLLGIKKGIVDSYKNSVNKREKQAGEVEKEAKPVQNPGGIPAGSRPSIYPASAGRSSMPGALAGGSFTGASVPATGTIAPLPPRPTTLLTVNNGRPGPVSGKVPVCIDARSDADLAFVLLNIDGKEEFAGNGPFATRTWDTTKFENGFHVVEAESHAPYERLRRRTIRVEVYNPEKGPRAGDTAERALPADLPKPSWKSVTVLSGTQPEVIVDGVRLIGSRAFVPLRRVVNAAGGKVSWEPEPRQAGAMCNLHNAAVLIGRKDAKKDGAPLELNLAPLLRQDRTQIGARALGSLLNLKVEWLHDSKSVRLLPKGEEPKP